MRHSQKLDPQQAEAMMDRMIGEPPSDRDIVQNLIGMLRRHPSDTGTIVVQVESARKLADALERTLEGGG